MTELRPEEEYHEDMGCVLWWYVNNGHIEEAPWVGTPNCIGQEVALEITLLTALGPKDLKPDGFLRTHVGGWPGYHTHFSPLPEVTVASAYREESK